MPRQNVSRDKIIFVETKICLSSQTFCRDKHTFLKGVFCDDTCGSDVSCVFNVFIVYQ